MSSQQRYRDDCNDQSPVSERRHLVSPTPDLRSREAIDFYDGLPNKHWSDYKKHVIDRFKINETRTIESIPMINSITLYYEKLLLKEERDPSQVSGLKAFPKYKEIYFAIKRGNFNWEAIADELEEPLELIKETISKFHQSIDNEMIKSDLFQLMFPVDMIDKLLSVVSISYGERAYNESLRIQNCLMEIFLTHHLKSDTRFYTRISTESVNMIDPFLRIKIRDMNSSDPKLNDKYNSVNFNIKEFILRLLNDFFPNVTWRYIGISQEMHRWIVETILYMLELGMWKIEDLKKLLEILFLKQENLLILERRSYEDMANKSIDIPTLESNLKVYFQLIKTTFTGICVQIFLLINDESFKESHSKWNTSINTSTVDYNTAWMSAVHNNEEVANFLGRILTIYILRGVNDDKKMVLLPKNIQFINDLLKMFLDTDQDVSVVSSKIVNDDMIEFYMSPDNKKIHDYAQEQRGIMIGHLSNIACYWDKKFHSHISDSIVNDLKSLLSHIQSSKENSKKELLYTLSLYNIPKIVMTINSATISLQFNSNCTEIANEVMVELLKSNLIGQTLTFDDAGMSHFNNIGFKNQLTSALAIEEIFTHDMTLLYNHTPLIKQFLNDFACAIKKNNDYFKKFYNRPGVEVARQGFEEVSNTQSYFYNFLIFAIFCRWIIKLIDCQNETFDEKFIDLDVQEIIKEIFFNLFLQIIQDDGYMPTDSNGKYEFTAKLEHYTAQDYKNLLEAKVSNKITGEEYRFILFEIAMMSLTLMNKCCRRFYTYSVGIKMGKKHLVNILKNTEYLFNVDGGLHYRKEVLELYSLFYIFPNNHLLVKRSKVFHNTSSSSAEQSILKSHYNGGIVDKLITELKLVDRTIENMNMFGKNSDKDGKSYYLLGVFKIVFKYINGLLVLYTKDDHLKELHSNIKKLKESFEENSPKIRDNFGINLSFKSIEAKEDKTDSSVPGNKKQKRSLDPYEKIFPILYELRNMLQGIKIGIQEAFSNQSDSTYFKGYQKFYDAYYRETILDSNKYFDNSETVKSKINIKNQNAASMDLSKKLIDKKGLTSMNMRYLRELMEAYCKNKRAAIENTTSDNMIIKFFDSKSGSIENVIGYIIKTSNCILPEQPVPQNHQRRELSPNQLKEEPPQEYQVMDSIIINFLQNNTVFTAISFFDKLMNHSKSIKEALYACLSKDDGEGKRFMTVQLFILKSLIHLTCFKPFMDADWKTIKEKFNVYTSFFKNLCENNYTKFKDLYSTMIPSYDALPSFNRSKKTLILVLYVEAEGLNSTFNHINSSNRLLMEDKAELYPYILKVMMIINEAICGPHSNNQTQVYRYKTGMWMGIIKRQIDNIASFQYEFKRTILDYYLYLTENNSKIIRHFGSNITFEELLELIRVNLKKLYIYSVYSQDEKKYKDLLMKAREPYEKMRIRREKEIQEYNESQKGKFSFYKQDSNNTNDGHDPLKMSIGMDDNQDINDSTTFSKNEMNIITSQMDQVIQVTDWKELFEIYNRSPEFTKHTLFEIVIKLNDLLTRCTQSIPGYSISLQGLYTTLISKYGDRVPLRIRRKMGHIEMTRENETLPEALVFYMFLQKITSEVEIVNPATSRKEKVLFPRHPATFFLTNQTKVDFMNEVPLHQTLTALIGKYTRFSTEMTENLQSYVKLPLFYTMSSDDFFERLKKFLWLLGFTLNILLIIYYRGGPDETTIIYEGRVAIYILAIIVTTICVFFSVIWFISRYPLKIKLAQIDYGNTDELISKYEKVKNKLEVYVYHSIFAQSYVFVFFIHIFSSILGITISPFFLTIQLLTIVFISDTTNYVVKAITTHFDQLALTFMLLVFVIYGYSVLTAERFYSNLELNSNQDTSMCNQLWECLLYHVDLGLRNGGGIGEEAHKGNPRNTGAYVEQFFWELIFFMIINIMFLNIIFGIIVDTFASMRNNYKERERNEIEKKGGNFEEHLNHDHYYWQYVNYLLYLDSKDRETFTGMENQIWEKYIEKNAEFIPQNGLDEDELTKQIDVLMKTVNDNSEQSKASFEKLSDAVASFESNMRQIESEIKTINQKCDSLKDMVHFRTMSQMLQEIRDKLNKQQKN